MQRWTRRAGGVVRGLGRIGGLWMAVAGLAAAPVLVVTAPAVAQSDIKAVDPYVVVVTTDNAPIRCSNGVQLFYSVRDAKAGETLRVNGEGPGWLRVEYTPGMKAYVPASEVEAARDAQTVKLTRPSRLLAVCADGKRPWWPLDLDADIPAGTTLKVSKVYQTPDNVIEGYYVDAPPRARGYVKPEHVRKATPDEAAKHAGATPPAAPAKPADGAPAAAPSPGTAPTTQPPAAVNLASQPAGSGVVPAPTANNPAPAGTPPGFTPTTAPGDSTATPGATPGGVTPVAPSATTTPVEPAPVVVTPPPPPPPPKDEELEQIKTTFDKVMSTGGDSELPNVIGMFEKKMSKLGTGVKDQQIKTALQQRLEALKLRQEVLEARDRARQAVSGRTAEMQRISLIVSEAQRQAIYNIVGRIQPSTVYDGKRGLPLMYRVESADALSPRTVGYIIPTEGTDLLTKIGKVCGVVGENRFDNSLQLNIIAPRRIDVLDVGATVTSPSGVFGTTPAAPTGETPAPTPISTPPTTVVPVAPAEPEK